MAVRPLKRGAGHLGGAPVQPLLLLRYESLKHRCAFSKDLVIHHHRFLAVVREEKKKEKNEKKGQPPAAGSAVPRSPLLWRFGPPGHGELSGNRN